MLKSIGAKTTASSLVVILGAMALSYLASDRLFRDVFTDAMLAKGQAAAQTVAVQLERIRSLGIALDELEGFGAQCREALATYPDLASVAVFSADGAVRFQAVRTGAEPPGAPTGAIIALTLDTGTPTLLGPDDTAGAAFVAVVPAARGPSGAFEGVVVATVPAAAITDRMARVRLMWLAIAGGLGLLAALALLLLNRRLVRRPLGRLLASIRATTDDTHPAHRVAVTSADELGVIGAAFNDMLDRIAQSRRELKAQSEELAEALEAERRLSIMQRQFVAMVSHEFRTPLTAMDGKARQIERRAGRYGDAAAEDLAPRAGAIRQSVTRLVELMECVLMTARLDEGEVKFQPAPGDFEALVRDAVAGAAESFSDRAFSVDVDDGLRDVVFDATLMRQVLSNLLSNAGKYTDGGGRIHVLAGRDAAMGEIRVSVVDDGIGMAPEDTARMAERFFRAKTSVGRPGTGLGLSIVARFLSLHGGRLDVTSEEGVGSTFMAVIRDDIAPGACAVAA
jgi:signal transduction histidine kinase